MLSILLRERKSRKFVLWWNKVFEGKWILKMKINKKRPDDCQDFFWRKRRGDCVKEICRWHIFSTKREKMEYIFGLADRTNPLGWRIPPKKKKPWKTQHLAEAEGFEPSCRITPTTAFRVRLITTALIRFQHEHYTTLIGFFQLIIEIVLIFIGKILSFFLLKLYVKYYIIFL